MSPEDVALAKVLAAWEQWPDSDEDEEAPHGELLFSLTHVLRQAGWINRIGVVTAGRDLIERARGAGHLL